MSVKIGLISDVHATPEPLREALELFQREQVATILCAGDVAGYSSELDATAQQLIESSCQTVAGNHDLWHLRRRNPERDSEVDAWLRGLPLTMALTMEGQRIAMVHASPPDSTLEGIRLLDEEGRLLDSARTRWGELLRGCRCDVLIVGHTHQVFAERLGQVLVINPGSTRFNHSCATLQLPELTVTFHAL
ncbi:MAG TPA: YfcE family phosphodiesterase, partial [Geothermobacteraceae bacterium]|nr:YfcE family phosphodiesterase [Geothermobacteraceae bacterium]